jgi:hypothetical protein
MFFLLHRPRRFNAQEARGWARSASAASSATSTRCCAAAAASASSLIVGDVERLAGVRYVITLDTDTDLPRDTGRS